MSNSVSPPMASKMTHQFSHNKLIYNPVQSVNILKSGGFSLLFYFKKPKKHSGSSLPIYMRVSVDSERTEISTQRKWDPNRWNVAAERASGTKEDAKSLNIYLDTLQSRVYEAQRQLIADNEEVTISTLKRLGGGTKEKSRMLIEIFENHNNQLAQLVGKDCAEGTLERYKVAKRHTVNFLQWKFKTSDIDILDLNGTLKKRSGFVSPSKTF